MAERTLVPVRARRVRHLVPTTVTLGVVGVLSWSALAHVLSVGSGAPRSLRVLIAAVVLVPAWMLVRSVSRDEPGVAWPAYWLWSFVFLGLAPAYQIALGIFPWQLVVDESSLRRALLVILVGHGVVLLTAAAVNRRRRASDTLAKFDISSPRTARLIVNLLVAQIAIASLFAVLMGPRALVSGRASFQSRLLEVAAIPAGGSLYFLAIALSITLPAVCIYSRRLGAAVPLGLITVSVVVGLLVTNPFIGSRFLSGAFLVAVVGAAVIGREVARYLPAAMILVFVLIFPSLDLWRGDGTGAASIGAISPAQSLITFDFDSFELLTRAVMLHDGPGRSLIDVVMLVVAPVLRWVPVLSNQVAGSASGPLVAGATGMTYRNVSMPLWGEGYLAAGAFGAAVALGMLGAWLGRLRRSGGADGGGTDLVRLFDAPTGALLFIVLRGSLYEVLGYLLLVVVVYLLLRRTQRISMRQTARTRPGATPAIVQQGERV